MLEKERERPRRREIREAREELVMQNAEHLSERRYKNFLATLDYEKMNDVIIGNAYHTMETFQSVRGSTKYINVAKKDPDNLQTNYRHAFLQ